MKSALLDIDQLGQLGQLGRLDQAFAACAPFRMEQHPQEIRPFVEYLLEHVQPVHALEIGVRHGGTAALWTQICSGQVIGIDWYGMDSLGKAMTDQLASSMRQRYDNYHFVCGDSHQQSTRDNLVRLMDVYKIDTFDLIFLDADHSYTGVKKDFEVYRDLLSTHGVIAFHDIVASDFMKQVGHGVWKFWQELKDHDTYNCREFSIGADWGGLGCLSFK